MPSRGSTKPPARKSKSKGNQPLRLKEEGGLIIFQPLIQPLTSEEKEHPKSSARKSEPQESQPLPLRVKEEYKEGIITIPPFIQPLTDEEEEFLKKLEEYWKLHPEQDPLIQKQAPELLDSPDLPPPSIEHPEAETHGRKMVEQDDKVFTKDGVRYRPLPLAAQLAQAPRQTLLNWIKNKTEFAGRPLHSYYLAPVDRYFVSEESIQRMTNRFVKWPSQEPAGPVTIGETKDQSGYIGISKAARTLHVDHHTMWLWTAHGKAPTDKLLDVIKCTTSDHFYIREKDVSALKAFVPRSGLRRGRRPQLAFES